MSFATKALFLQVRDALAARITQGVWEPGVSLPSEGDLAREFGVSAGTMRKALDLLEAERLIVRRQGRGTFVSNPTSQELSDRYIRLFGPDGERIRCPEVHVTECGRCVASTMECARLRLRAGDEVYRVRRVRRYRDKDFIVEDVALPAALFPGLCEKTAMTHDVGVLARQYGLLLGKAEERLRVCVPPPDIAEIIGVLPGKPVILLERTVMTRDGRPAEWRTAHCDPNGTYYLADMN
jgi:GntR family transcriptional regulator